MHTYLHPHTTHHPTHVHARVSAENILKHLKDGHADMKSLFLHILNFVVYVSAHTVSAYKRVVKPSHVNKSLAFL